MRDCKKLLEYHFISFLDTLVLKCEGDDSHEAEQLIKTSCGVHLEKIATSAPKNIPDHPLPTPELTRELDAGGSTRGGAAGRLVT